MQGYKVFTHDLCSPIQGGAPVWNGTLPFELPKVKLDRSKQQCAEGWNFVQDIKTGLFIAGLWPNGRPSRVFVVKSKSAIKRGNKYRTQQLTILEEVDEETINAVIYDLILTFKDHKKHMAESQIEWRRALGRPFLDEEKIEKGLIEALEVRGLSSWSVKKYSSVKAARDAWVAWDKRDASYAKAAFEAGDAGTAKDLWTSRAANAAWDASVTWTAWDVWAPWTPKEVWYGTSAAKAAWDAMAALQLEFSALNGWVESASDFFTRGIRTAYENGLEVCTPTNIDELGWVAKEVPGQ